MTPLRPSLDMELPGMASPSSKNTDKSESLPSREALEFVIKILREIIVFLAGRKEDFEKSLKLLEQVADPAELDRLEMQPSQYGAGGFTLASYLKNLSG